MLGKWWLKLRQMSKVKLVLLSVAVLVLGCAAGFTILIFPNNPLTNYFSSKISNLGGKVVVGPYPDEEDFAVLKRNNVKTIVSLLNPWVPYERILLDRERATAEKYQIEVLNFPLTSVLGRGMGAEYSKNASDAAETIARLRGKVYLHCYLGLHRADVVRGMLRAKGVRIGDSIIAETERPDDVWLRDNAQSAYEAGEYQLALERVRKIKEPDEPARLLTAWCEYRLGNISAAREQFEGIVKESGNGDARTGLAYTALRTNDLKTADEQFSETLKKHPGSAPALSGMGMVRYRQGRTAEACKFLGEAAQLSPRDGDVRDLRAKLNCDAMGK